jgi:hypothetical protein
VIVLSQQIVSVVNPELSYKKHRLPRLDRDFLTSHIFLVELRPAPYFFRTRTPFHIALQDNFQRF